MTCESCLDTMRDWSERLVSKGVVHGHRIKKLRQHLECEHDLRKRDYSFKKWEQHMNPKKVVEDVVI